ncbi:protease inhibitor I42 family protein [Streptomyces lonegramiae]|uniref:Protease inhibitor I42 family protein n=1 Tax=Streptomyces lonegramiae TaxID=3075524 RepID=A0ABU2XTS3_9ACTN|nr:protease inhibitor I42 family protein [Streptomyces sp. DSM 41529]MDT0548849.1 protease inhibitor I42 family protein [Streptomyces sp. DSM 41529]
MSPFARRTSALLLAGLALCAAGCQDTATPSERAEPTSASSSPTSSPTSSPSPSADPEPTGLGTVHQDPAYSKDLDRTEGPITVKSGERFSIAMRQNISARADWSLAEPGPSAAVLRKAGESSYQTAREKELVGGGSTKYFTFEAVKAGQTRIVLANSFGTDKSAGGYSPTLPRTVTYQVTVR